MFDGVYFCSINMELLVCGLFGSWDNWVCVVVEINKRYFLWSVFEVKSFFFWKIILLSDYLIIERDVF